MLTQLNEFLKDLFAHYIVLDNYGTRRLCWTMAEARSWLEFCSPVAFICETVDYTIIEARSY